MEISSEEPVTVSEETINDQTTSSANDSISNTDSVNQSFPGTLKEYGSMQYLTDIIPSYAQRGFLTTELKLTCVDAISDYIALGSNIGTAFLYRRNDKSLLRLRHENYSGIITCIKIHKSGDSFLAAGTTDGCVLVYQVMLLGETVEVLKFKINGHHTGAVTAIEMSPNGENVFSGDVTGKVLYTELDYQTQSSVSSKIVEESHDIVQLSYYNHQLVISSTYRSVLHHISENKTTQIGQQERKSLGFYGAVITSCDPVSRNPAIYAVRPNFRIWKANMEGVVEETIILKERQFSCVIPISSEPHIVKERYTLQQFETLLVYNQNYLLTWNKQELILLDMVMKKVVGECILSSDILGVSESEDEIFILLQNRKLIRIATAPEKDSLVAELEDKAEEVPFLQDIALPFQDIKKVVKERGSSLSSIISSKSQSESMKLQSLISNKANPTKLFNWVKTGFTFKQSPFSSPSKQSNTAPSAQSEVDTASNNEDQVDGGNKMDQVPLMVLSTSKAEENDLTESHSHEMSGASTSSAADALLDSQSYNQHEPNKEIHTSEISTTKLEASGEDSRTSLRVDDGVADIVYSRKKKKVKKPRGRSRSPQPDNKHQKRASLNLDNSSCSSDSFDNKSVVDTTAESLKISTEQDVNGCSEHEDVWNNNSADNAKKVSNLNSNMNEDEHLQRILEAYNRAKMAEKIETNERNLCRDDEQPNNPLHDKASEDCEELGTISIPSNQQADDKTKALNLQQEQSGRLTIDTSKKSMVEITNENQDVDDDTRSPYSPEPKSDDPTVNDCDIDTSSLSIYDEPINELPSDNNDIFGEIYTSDWIEYRVPSPVLNVSSCLNYVCWIDNKECLYFANLKTPGLSWVQADRRAQQVSVSPSGNIVWILHKNTAYSAKNPSSEGPKTSHWLGAANSVKCISVDDSSAWYVDLSGELYTQQKLSFDQPLTYPKKVNCNYTLQQVSCLNGVIWALTTSDKLICISATEALLDYQAQWKIIACKFPITSVALGVKNTGWVVDNIGKLWFRVGVSTTTPGGSDGKWWKTTDCFCDLQQLPFHANTTSQSSSNNPFNKDFTVTQHKPMVLDESCLYPKSLRQSKGKLSITQEKVAAALLGNQRPSLTITEIGVWYCRPWSNVIHTNRRNVVGHHWGKMRVSSIGSSSRWTHLSASSVQDDKGVIWAVHCSGELICFTVDGSPPLTISLPNVSSELLCLSSTLNALWVLTASGEVHLRKGMSPQCPTGSSWVKLNLFQLESAKLVHISMSDQLVWACDVSGRVLMRLGSLSCPTTRNLTPAWMFVDGEVSNAPTSFVKVCVGPNTFMVWAIDIKKRVYVREGITLNMPVGTEWLIVPDVEANELAISNNAVWVLTPSGEIYRRFGISESNCAGDYWKKVSGNMKHISVSINDELWALSIEGYLYHHAAHLLKFNCQKLESVSLRQMSTDENEEDWVML